MSFISEFKEFAMKGNVVDMAVGIIGDYALHNTTNERPGETRAQQ